MRSNNLFNDLSPNLCTFFVWWIFQISSKLSDIRLLFGQNLCFLKSKIVDFVIVADVRFSKFILSRVLTNSYYIIFISRFVYIWIQTVVNTSESSQTCYFWESILQPCISGANSSCDIKQFDFKIFENHFGKYPSRLLDLLLSEKVPCHCAFVEPYE